MVNLCGQSRTSTFVSFSLPTHLKFLLVMFVDESSISQHSSPPFWLLSRPPPSPPPSRLETTPRRPSHLSRLGITIASRRLRSLTSAETAELIYHEEYIVDDNSDISNDDSYVDRDYVFDQEMEEKYEQLQAQYSVFPIEINGKSINPFQSKRKKTYITTECRKVAI